MAVCPQGCITVLGRDLSPADVGPLPKPADRATYASLTALMQSRRSVRRFTDQPVAQADIDRIVTAATTAPMGLPPSEVSVLLLSGREKVQAFRRDLVDAIRPWRWFFSAPMLTLMRPFMSRDGYRSMKSFVAPAVDAYLGRSMGDGDWFFYGAPLAMMFYGSLLADPADPILAATYAMLAAESLGLATCMLGFPAHIAQHSSAVRRQYQLPRAFRPGVTLIVGHSAVPWQRSITRRFARVHCG
jgi:nitroreductase